MTVSGSSMGIIRPLGVVFLMGACLTSGAYKTVNRRTAQEFTAFERTYVVMLACAAAFTLSALRTIKGDLAAYVRPLSDPEVPDLRGGAEPVLLHPLQQHGQLRGGEDVRGEAVAPGISDHPVFHVCRRSAPA